MLTFKILWSEHPMIEDNQIYKGINEIEKIIQELQQIHDSVDKQGYFKTKFELYLDGENIHGGRIDLGCDHLGMNPVMRGANYLQNVYDNWEQNKAIYPDTDKEEVRDHIGFFKVLNEMYFGSDQ